MIQGVAVLTLTFLIAALIPFAGPLVLILAPLPIIYYCISLGRLRGLTILAVSLCAAYFALDLAGHRASLVALSMIGFTGVLLTEILKRNLSVEKTIFSSSAALFCLGAAFVFYHSFRSDMTVWRMIESHVSMIIEENIKLYAQMNIADEQINIIRENSSQLALFFAGIFPALGLSGIVITVWINLMTARGIFRRGGLPFPDFGDLAAWKAPEKIVWILIAAGGFLIIPLDGMSIVGLNILIICCLIYLFQGLAIIAFFFRKKRVPKIFRLLFYVLVLVQHYMLILVTAAGLFDLWIDFRKRITEPNSNIS